MSEFCCLLFELLSKVSQSAEKNLELKELMWDPGMMESCLMYTGKEKKLSNAISAINVIEDIQSPEDVFVLSLD